jgi:RHH-type proline utilization regulon transcriptional repressor/proline dehydrogenase/delta 1-pyrroline-5-carboxylate dehydrogenase
VIAPWNFPLAILTGMTSAALVAGNAVMSSRPDRLR